MNTATVEVHDLPAGVQGLIQLGRNAIDRVSELERDIAKRDETIRQLRAQLDKYEQAPTVAWLATQQQRNPSQCVVTTKLDGWDHAELIARPTRKGDE